jgi:hypothetical protein
MNVSQDVNDTAGFAPEEIITSEPTRSARLKWVIVADEASAQTNRSYDDYLAELAETKPEDLTASAVSIIGPRNRISKLVRNLDLLR